jgi:hypothetical protein
MNLQFHLKDFDDLHFFLGIEVIRHDNDILLSQHNYLQYLMAKT